MKMLLIIMLAIGLIYFSGLGVKFTANWTDIVFWLGIVGAIAYIFLKVKGGKET